MTLVTDVLQYGTGSHPTTSETANAYATDLLTDGVVGATTNTSGVAPATGAFAVNATGTPDTNVQISAGVAYVTATPTSQGSQRLRAKNSATITQAIAANASGSTRYDWIYIKLDPTNAANPNAAADNVASILVSRSTSSSTDNGTPPSYGYCIAVVTVANGFSTITNGNIADKRATTGVSVSSATVATTGWQSLSVQPTVSTGYNNGQKEFNLTFSNIDLSSTLSAGMRLKVARGTTPPTQAMAFTAASSQYATKASPSGLSFTTTYTLEAWVYLNSYTSGQCGIVSGYNGTNGFVLSVLSSGQLSLNAGSSTHQDSYQSLPLKRWVHVAGTFSSGTMNLYLNGVLAPSAKTGSSTSITQAGALQVGAFNSTGFFDGYLSEVRVWSAAQTQTQVRDNQFISLTGAETNLVFLAQGNGNFNDSTSNANNLTANGGAIATQAANPYNSTEYAIITKVAYSAPNSTVTVFTGTDYGVPNMSLNSCQYAIGRAPFGFPAARGRWIVDSWLCAEQTKSSGFAINTYYDLNWHLAIPTGEWAVAMNSNPLFSFSANVVADGRVALSSSTSAASDPELTGVLDVGNTGNLAGCVTLQKEGLVLSAQTTYMALLGSTQVTSMSSMNWYASLTAGSTVINVIRAVSAYL